MEKENWEFRDQGKHEVAESKKVVRRNGCTVRGWTDFGGVGGAIVFEGVKVFPFCDTCG